MLSGEKEKPLPLLFLPLQVMPSVTSQVFTFTVPTSSFPAISSSFQRLGSLVKRLLVMPQIEEFILLMQLSVESTVERKQMGSRQVTFWQLKAGKSDQTLKMAGFMKWSGLAWEFTVTTYPPLSNLISSLYFQASSWILRLLSQNSAQTRKGARQPQLTLTPLASSRIREWMVQFAAYFSKIFVNSSAIQVSRKTRLTELKFCPLLLKQARAMMRAAFSKWCVLRSFMTQALSDEVSKNSFSRNTSLTFDMQQWKSNPSFMRPEKLMKPCVSFISFSTAESACFGSLSESTTHCTTFEQLLSCHSCQISFTGGSTCGEGRRINALLVLRESARQANAERMGCRWSKIEVTKSKGSNLQRLPWRFFC